MLIQQNILCREQGRKSIEERVISLTESIQVVAVRERVQRPSERASAAYLQYGLSLGIRFPKP